MQSLRQKECEFWLDRCRSLFAAKPSVKYVYLYIQNRGDAVAVANFLRNNGYKVKVNSRVYNQELVVSYEQPR